MTPSWKRSAPTSYARTAAVPLPLTASVRPISNVLTTCLAVSYDVSMNPGEIARLLGSRGGKARAARLTSDERRRIAAQGGKARRDSADAARRIADTLRYAAAVKAMRKPPAVTRLSRFRGRLPGVDTR